jgi:DNA repair photolyase
MQKAAIKESNYKNCINFGELDLSNTCKVDCIYCGMKSHSCNYELFDIKDILKGSKPEKGIYLSPNSDPFYGEVAELSHRILKKFLPEGVDFLIITKSKIPKETIDLLSRYSNQVITKISLSRLDQELTSYIEPGAASVKDRLSTMRELANAGLTVKALLMPLYPSIDDTEENLGSIVYEFKRAGVSIVKASYVLIRKGDKEKDKEIINKMLSHPLLRKSWELMSESIKPHIGSAIVPPLERRIKLYKTLTDLCSINTIKFVACSVLDPEILEVKSNGQFTKCRNIWMYHKRVNTSTKTIVEFPSELNQNNIEKIFQIYESVYHPQEIGVGFEEWTHNIKRLYHGRYRKLIQLLVSSSGSIVGYLAFTEPVLIEGKFWSKILEGGIYSDNLRNSRDLFIEMFNQLVHRVWNSSVNFIGEVGIKYSHIDYLLSQSNFIKINDDRFAKNLLKHFLEPGSFNIANLNGTIIKRQTKYDKNYEAYLMLRNNAITVDVLSNLINNTY